MNRVINRHRIQKKLLVLVCILLITSPFSNVGGKTFAEEKQIEKDVEEISDKKLENIKTNKKEDEEEAKTKEDSLNSLDDEPKMEIKDEVNSDKREGDQKPPKEKPKEKPEEIEEKTTEQKDSKDFIQLQTNAESDYEWEDNEDGTVTITNYIGSDKNLVIPDELAGKTVTILGERSFMEKEIQRIELPNTIKEIGISALSSNQLTSIILPEGLERIADHAFIYNKLTSVEIPSSVKIIGNHTFIGNEFTSITLHGKETFIVSSAFNQTLNKPYENLIVYGFANSTAEAYANDKGYTFEPFEGTVVGVQAIDDIEVPFGFPYENIPLPNKGEVTVEFNGKNEVHEVEIDWDKGNPVYDPNEAGTYTFEGEFLFDTYIKNPNNIKATVEVIVSTLALEWSDNGDGTITITKYNGRETEVFIPNKLDGKDVTAIGERAFYERELTKITLPETLNLIGKHAFNKNKLTTVDIPEGVTFIDSFAFRQNKIEKITFPNTLETIGSYAFTTNKLTEVEIPDSVTDIGIWAFKSNELEKVELSNNLTTLGNQLFKNNNLTYIELPDSVERIGNEAFANNSLEEVILPTSINYIANRAFENNKLGEVIVLNKGTSFKEDVFAHDTKDSQDVIMKGFIGSTAETYADSNNHTFASFIDIPDDHLKQAINRELGKSPTNKLTKIDLETLTELDAYRREIADLTGIQYATNLEKLNLESNNIKDITELTGLTKLESINLGSNEIRDLSPVKNLTNLQQLLIDHNKISEITALENLEKLTSLDLSNNKIGSITPLKNLTNLESLLLNNTNLDDISELSSFSGLITLGLEDNKINDITFLESLTNLQELYLANNKISDLSPLGGYFGNLQDGSLVNQEITLPTIKLLDTAKTLEIDHPIIFHDGSLIDDVTVQDGTYENPQIKWPVTGSEAERTFTFEEKNYGFSGRVIQPIEWVKDEKPVIHVSDYSILLNEPFDPLEGVTASDKESGDLTQKIKVVKNEVVTSKTGIYEVTYSVTDDGGQTVEKTIMVTVTEPDVVDTETLSDLMVSYGTTKDDIGLPEEVDVTLNNGDSMSVAVKWNNGEPIYNPLKARTYIFKGSLQLPSNVTNSNHMKVTAKVTVEEMTLSLADRKEVYAGTEVPILGTNTIIAFPDDLPAGTTLEVIDVSDEDFVTKSKEIEVAGDVLDFIFHYPKGEKFDGSFTLTMIYNEDYETDVDIYYYNSEENTWERQAGSEETATRAITIEPEHFSVYGIFAKIPTDDDDKQTVNGKGGPSDNGELNGKGGPSDNGEVNGKGGPVDKSDLSINVAKVDKKSIEKNNRNLPKTATKIYQILLIGITLVLLGLGISYVVRRKSA